MAGRQLYQEGSESGLALSNTSKNPRNFEMVDEQVEFGNETESCPKEPSITYLDICIKHGIRLLHKLGKEHRWSIVGNGSEPIYQYQGVNRGINSRPIGSNAVSSDCCLSN